MKLNDLVSLKMSGSSAIKAKGKVIRVDKQANRVGVMWYLDEGGILCQTEDFRDLKVITDRKKKCTSQNR